MTLEAINEEKLHETWTDDPHPLLRYICTWYPDLGESKSVKRFRNKGPSHDAVLPQTEYQ